MPTPSRSKGTKVMERNPPAALRAAGVLGRVRSQCVRDFNDFAFMYCASRRAVLDIERKGINRFHPFHRFDRATQRGGRSPVKLAIVDRGERRFTRREQPRSALCDRIEHRLHIGRGTADDVEHIGRGGLVFERFLQTRACAPAPRRTAARSRWRSRPGRQRSGPARSACRVNGRTWSRVRTNDADRLALAQQRNAENRAGSQASGACARVVYRNPRHARRQYEWPSFQRHARCNRRVRP